MEKNRVFLKRFMRVTGLTSYVLGPAQRSNLAPMGKHRIPSEEEVEAEELASKTWEVFTTTTGERYAVDLPHDDADVTERQP
jgi:hypothetical protein